MTNAEIMTDDVAEEGKKVPFWRQYLSCFRLRTKDIAANAIIAALYVALTYAFYFISYGPFQCRISEFLTLLCFFNPNYAIGLTIGCALSNIYSITSGLLGPWDILFGSMATLLACLLMPMVRSMFVSTLLPCLSNGVIISLEFILILHLDQGSGMATSAYFWVQFGWIFLGEFLAISILGYVLFYLMSKRVGGFYKIINAKLNLGYKF